MQIVLGRSQFASLGPVASFIGDRGDVTRGGNSEKSPLSVVLVTFSNCALLVAISLSGRSIAVLTIFLSHPPFYRVRAQS